MSVAELDRACITAAGDKLASLLGREAAAGRTLPTGTDPDGDILAERIVELNAMSAGLPTTYMFYCGRFVDGSVIATPMAW
jgi:hypothetical protein